MEERLVTDSYGDKQVPLHTLVAATNELFEEESGATWDRFALRVEAKLVTSGKNFLALLEAPDDEPTTIEQVNQSELELMRKTCKQMASRMSDSVKQALVRLWSSLPGITEYRPSNRRWKKMLKVAAANALLNGRSDIEPEDLSVGSLMLWSNPNERKDIDELVKSTVDPDSKEIAEIEKTIQGIVRIIDQIIDGDDVKLELIATTNLNIDKLIRHCKPKVGARWSVIREELDRLKEVVSENYSL
jgi:MoxR-like ATPase